MKSCWVLLLTDFMGAIGGTIVYIVFCDMLVKDKQCLYENEPYENTNEEKQKLI